MIVLHEIDNINKEIEIILKRTKWKFWKGKSQ